MTCEQSIIPLRVPGTYWRWTWSTGRIKATGPLGTPRIRGYIHGWLPGKHRLIAKCWGAFWHGYHVGVLPPWLPLQKSVHCRGNRLDEKWEIEERHFLLSEWNTGGLGIFNTPGTREQDSSLQWTITRGDLAKRFMCFLLQSVILCLLSLSGS